MTDLFDILAAQDDTLVLVTVIEAVNEADGTEHFVAFPIKDVVFKPPVDDSEVARKVRHIVAGSQVPLPLYTIPLGWVTAAGLLKMNSFALGAEMMARGCEPIEVSHHFRRETRRERRRRTRRKA
jgi:hypothetical protein